MITSVEIDNFKSIQRQHIELNKVNILIGPNGAGKSNLISLFQFLKHLADQNLEEYIFKLGGINNLLYNGFEESDRIKLTLIFEEKPYSHIIHLYTFNILSDGETYAFLVEGASYSEYQDTSKTSGFSFHPHGKKESVLKEKAFHAEHKQERKIAREVYELLKGIKVFHFHDTSDNAQSKIPQNIEDVHAFKAEAENLAPFLLHLREHHFETYFRIVETIRLVYPQFHDFALEESPFAKGKVTLRWQEKGTEKIYTAKQISDGTLRFISLSTLLLQSPDSSYVPSIIILDEPELGLHPFAISILAELIQKAALHRQVILATQSVELVNYFTPKDLLVADRSSNGATNFKRMKDEDFKVWLEDYSLGQLWEGNFFGGRP